MKVILVLVSTLNGKITYGNDPEVRHWSSKSDQEYFNHIWADSELIVMGSRTYDLNRIKPAKGRLIVVVTSRPADYSALAIASQLEFTDMKPKELADYYAVRSFNQMTVVGGRDLATSFLKDSIVDELWLTLEPRLFGKGLNLIADDELDIHLKLAEVKKVNDNGTLITKYSIVRNQSLTDHIRSSRSSL